MPLKICRITFLRVFSPFSGKKVNISLVFYLFILIECKLLYRILLFSVKPQHESAIGIIYPLPFEPPSHLPPQPTPLGWYRAPVWVSWDIQQIPIGYFRPFWGFPQYVIISSKSLMSISESKLHTSVIIYSVVLQGVSYMPGTVVKKALLALSHLVS